MKTSTYIEDGIVQLVVTPESEFEQNALSTFREKPLDAKLFSGSFYDCRGGWIMQSAHYPDRNYYGERNHKDQSLILVARASLSATPDSAKPHPPIKQSEEV